MDRRVDGEVGVDDYNLNLKYLDHMDLLALHWIPMTPNK